MSIRGYFFFPDLNDKLLVSNFIWGPLHIIASVTLRQNTIFLLILALCLTFHFQKHPDDEWKDFGPFMRTWLSANDWRPDGPGLFFLTVKVARVCLIYILQNTGRPVAAKAAHLPPMRPFEDIMMDLMELTGSVGRKYCLVMSGMSMFFPVPLNQQATWPKNSWCGYSQWALSGNATVFPTWSHTRMHAYPHTTLPPTPGWALPIKKSYQYLNITRKSIDLASSNVVASAEQQWHNQEIQWSL